jgi:hypothetical protein
MFFGPGKDVGQKVADRATELYVRRRLSEEAAIPKRLHADPEDLGNFPFFEVPWGCGYLHGISSSVFRHDKLKI